MAIEKRIGAYSAYAIAVENGFTSTEKEWLESLIGPRGYQGWGVSAVSVSAEGSLIFTIKNPETGETRELEPIQIETLNALDSISTAKDEAVNEVKEAQTQATEAVGTAKTQAVQAVEDAENTGVSAVEDAKSNALTEVGEAKTTAVDAVNAAGTQAASDAQTAITAAKNQAVSDVQAAGQSAVSSVGDAQTEAVEAVETAQTNAVQSVQNAGTAEAEKISGILPVPTEADAGKVPVAKPDGSGYELGKAGVQIDDTKTALDTTWSSENIVSRLCPSFTVEGAVVTCNPVEGSQLNTIVQIEPVQEGTGDPSPENIRPIRGWDTIKLTHNEQEISIPLGQTVYGGTLDVGRGVLTVDRALRTLSDSENWLLNFDESNSLYWHSIILSGSEIADYLQANKSVSSHLKYGINTENGFWFANSGNNLRIANNISTTEEWKDYLISENSSGHPVQVLYYIATPVTLQLTPQEIRALSGVNTIYTDTGDVTVSGYSDPNAIIKSLAERIAALEQNAIGG